MTRMVLCSFKGGVQHRLVLHHARGLDPARRRDDDHRLGVVDAIVREPLGGGHRDKHTTIQAVGEAVQQSLADLVSKPGRELRELAAYIDDVHQLFLGRI